MPTLRFQALREASNRKPVQFEETDRKSTIFGSNVFNDKAMKQYSLLVFGLFWFRVVPRLGLL